MVASELGLLVLGLGCTAYFAGEVVRLALRARRGVGPAAWDARTGRPLRVRSDRRAPDRRGRRVTDGRPRRRS